MIRSLAINDASFSLADHLLVICSFVFPCSFVLSNGTSERGTSGLTADEAHSEKRGSQSNSRSFAYPQPR